jgi:hypothetical protein
MNDDQYWVRSVLRNGQHVERSSRPVNPIQQYGLPEGARIEERGEAGIWLVQEPPQCFDAEGKPKPKPDAIESRIDAKGETRATAWWAKFLQPAKAKS